MMEQQKVVKKPSRESIIKILDAANPEVKQRFLHDLIQSNKNVEKWFNRLPLGTRPSVGVAEVLNEFFNAFSNEMDAFAAISYVGSKLGLIFPTVDVTSGDGDDSVFTDATPGSPSYSPSSDSFGSTEFSTPSSSMGPTTFLNPFRADNMSTISDVTKEKSIPAKLRKPLEIGDTVRTVKRKATLDKYGTDNWSDRVFKVNKIIEDPNRLRTTRYKTTEVKDGKHYQYAREELQKVDPDIDTIPTY